MRQPDYAKRLRFIELALANASQADIGKEFNLKRGGVQWWYTTIYKELGVDGRKTLSRLRSSFDGTLEEFVAYRKEQAKNSKLEFHVVDKTKYLPKHHLKKVEVRALKKKEKKKEDVLLPIGEIS